MIRQKLLRTGSVLRRWPALCHPWVWATVAVALGILIVGVFSRYGLLTRWRVERRYEELQQRYHALLRQIDSLRHRIDRVQNDPIELERLARERYGMVRPGETLYVVPSAP